MALRIALLASGKGTNVINLLKEVSKFNNLEVVMVLVDQKDSPLLNLKLSVPVIFCEKKESMKKSDFEAEMLKVLKQYQVDWIFLAGFMRILTEKFLKEFYDEKLSKFKVLNIHPSLLPKYPGAHGFVDAYKAKEKISGITIHFVDAGVDTGEILLQMKFDLHLNDSFEEFVKKGKEIEMSLYPMAFHWLEQECLKNFTSPQH